MERERQSAASGSHSVYRVGAVDGGDAAVDDEDGAAASAASAAIVVVIVVGHLMVMILKA